VGVGSGAILLGLLHQASRALLPAGGAEAGRAWFRPLGIDVSPVALAYAIDNARLNRLPVPALVRGDLLSCVRGPGPAAPIAAIVSNPPYVTSREMSELPPEIREHEPPVALHGGDDGLDVVHRLLREAEPFVRAGAILCFEIGSAQEGGVRRALARIGLDGWAAVHPDLAGRPRVVLVEPPRRG
jgi:release factor glutamine methyltransferase